MEKNIYKGEALSQFAPYDPAYNNFTLTNNTNAVIRQLQGEDPSLQEGQLMGQLMQLFLDYSNAALQQDSAALAALLTADFARVHQAPSLFEHPNIELAYLNGYQDGSLIMVLVATNADPVPFAQDEKRYYLDYVRQGDLWKLDDLQLLDFSIGIDAL